MTIGSNQDPLVPRPDGPHTTEAIRLLNAEIRSDTSVKSILSKASEILLRAEEAFQLSPKCCAPVENWTGRSIKEGVWKTE